MHWFSLAMIVLGMILAIWRIASQQGVRSAKKSLGIFILYFIFFGIGINGLWEFLSQVVYSEATAEYLGWSTGSPFQIRVGLADLAFGVLGILCLWEGDDFMLATALGASFYLFGSGLVSLWQIVTRNNLAQGNAGLTLYFNLIFPIVLLVLMMIYRRLKPPSNNA